MAEHDRTLVLEIAIPDFFVSQEDIDFGWAHGIPENEELETQMNCDEIVQIIVLYEGDRADPRRMKVLEGQIVNRRTVARPT